MISKEKIWLIVIIVLTVVWTSINISRLTPEVKNYQTYVKALNEYNNNQFSDAFYTFGEITNFSKLKSAAVYRQALCADKVGDKKTEIKKYKEVIKHDPKSVLAMRSRYVEAQQFYFDKKFKKANKEFNYIIKRYPKTDYATAAQYYLGALETNKALHATNENKKFKAQKRAIIYFKNYLKEAPNGRFAINCINKWLSLNTKLTNEDNLIIAQTYQANEEYTKAKKYLTFTNLSVSWPYFVKNAYAMKDYSKVKYYTEHGLQGAGSEDVLINENTNDEKERTNIYKAIDTYLKVSNDPKTAISYLLSISGGANGYDYLLYKSCNNMPEVGQSACYNSLYTKYPDGQFAADALANIFYAKIKEQKYYMAVRIGRKHLSQFKNANSTPKVMFWLGKISERLKDYESARSYYRGLLRKYPDDYYSYRALLNLNRIKNFSIMDLTAKPIEFPYNTASYGLITELAKVRDYGLISQLYKDDKFIQSWLAYLQGDFALSASFARDAMEKLPVKPNKNDARWRLVYPIHYYNEIKENAYSFYNDPVLILSIIKEESYFNPKAQSPVGAMGLMQLMPSTAKEAGSSFSICLPDNSLLLNPEINIRLGNIYYAKLKRELLNKDVLAVLAYNGGIGSVSRWKNNLNYVDADDFIERIPYPETQNYLKKVYKSYWNYLRIYSQLNF